MNVSVISTQFDTASLVLFPSFFNSTFLFTMPCLYVGRLFLILVGLLFVYDFL